MPLLRLRDVSVEIRLRDRVVRPLDHVSFAIDTEESLGIVGESGSGKTMTSLSIMRQLPSGGRIVEGEITLDGRDLSVLPERDYRSVRGNEIGMIFQDPFNSLNPTMPIGVQVAEPLRLHRGLSRSAAYELSIEALDRVGMPQARIRAQQYPHQLSGGMRQRVMIAMALACEPSLLIADEPTTALDVTIQRQILDLIDQRRRELKMAVLLVTHDLGVVAGRTDRVAVMYAGRIMEAGPTSEVLAAPAHPYTQALLEAMPERAVDRGELLHPIAGMPPDLSDVPVGCPFAPRCRYATDTCRTIEPPLQDVGQGRSAACHYPLVLGRGEAGEIVSLAPEPAHSLLPQIALEGTSAGIVSTEREQLVSGHQAALEVSHLSKTYSMSASMFGGKAQVSAVSDVSFTIPAGQTFGVVGESGCGKTTLGKLLVGLEQPSAGSILIGGQAFETAKGATARQLRRDVQFMFQDSFASLDPRMRVRDILGEPLVIQNVGDAASRRARVIELLDEVGLGARALDRFPHEFSGGQRQRIGLARALALNPKVVIADEPASALDVSVQAQILNLMRDLQKRHSITYVFISHDLKVVRYMADTIGVMYLGKLVEIGPAEEVYSSPQHPYTRGLLEASPSVSA